MRVHRYYVYILTNRSRTLYIGVTNDLARRLTEHRQAPAGSFTGRYRLDVLVYFEQHRYILNAIAREKQLKGWRRARKIALIESENPQWKELEVPGGPRDPSGPFGPSG